MTKDIYLKFFNFRWVPFNLTPDPKFFFLSRQHEEAIESLIYGVNNRKGFMAVVGDIGTGKTTTCRALMDRLNKKNNIDTSVIFNPMLSIIELLEAINDDFGNRSAVKDTVKGHLDALNDFLLRRLKYEKNAVVLIDEAQNLSVEAMEMMRLLSNLETEDEKLIQIIFVGQKELGEKLRTPDLRQLNQRIGIRLKLQPLGFVETCQYVMHRLQIASFSGYARVKFNEEALRSIFEYTQGVPRLINMLCERALLEAFSEKEREITKEMIYDAALELEGALGISIKSKKTKPWQFWKWMFG